MKLYDESQKAVEFLETGDVHGMKEQGKFKSYSEDSFFEKQKLVQEMKKRIDVSRVLKRLLQDLLDRITNSSLILVTSFKSQEDISRTFEVRYSLHIEYTVYSPDIFKPTENVERFIRSFIRKE